MRLPPRQIFGKNGGGLRLLAPAPGGGDEYGLPAGKGYYLMTDAWFNEYMYQIIVKKGDLEDGLKPLLTSKPIELPAWDPLGALAAPGGH